MIRALTRELPTILHLDSATENVAHQFWGPRNRELQLFNALRSEPREVHFDHLDTSSDDQFLPALVWMDTLRAAWRKTPADAHYGKFYDGGIEQQPIAKTLWYLTRYRELRPAIEQYARAALQAGEVAPRHFTRWEMLSTGHALMGEIALAQDDTTRAIAELFATVRFPKTAIAEAAGHRLVEVAQSRMDTVFQIQALAAQKLLTDYETEMRLFAVGRLQSLWDSYVAGHDSVPDFLPASAMPNARATKSLDVYLDRHWSALYDWDFPVAPAPASLLQQSSRVVVVEHSTGAGCHGCWWDDRALWPLTRRYPANRVVLLTYGREAPLGIKGTEDLDSLWTRYDAWYPTIGGGITWRTQRSARISFQSRIGAKGDTLGGWPIDGLRGEPVGTELNYRWLELEGFQRNSARVDHELTRAPDADLRVMASWPQQNGHVDRDHIQASVRIDSIASHVRASGHPLAVRMVLYEDTVWIHTNTIRRIYLNVVREATQNDTLSLGLPVPPAVPAAVDYTFDVGAVERLMQRVRDDPKGLIQSARGDYYGDLPALWHPDPRDLRIDRSRLYVIAMIQDLTTGEILQAAVTKVRDRAPM